MGVGMGVGVQERQSLRNPDLDVPRDMNKLQASR